MSRAYPFAWVDVFSKSPLGGNQLAVFPDARGLTDEEMQAIARETHISETTFVMPEDAEGDRKNGYRTRIFTIFGELPFAGHPTLGTASVLRRTTGDAEVALRLAVGRIPVRFSEREGLPFGEMVQKEPEVGQTHDPTAVARALNVAPGDLDPNVPIQTLSTGVPFAVVPFRSLDVLSRANLIWSSMEGYLQRSDARFFYLVCPETRDPSANWHGRMVFSGGDDPATGSGAGVAIAWMVLHGLAPPEQTVVIEQGLEVARKSLLFVRAGREGGRPTNVRVGGHCAPVIEGELTL